MAVGIGMILRLRPASAASLYGSSTMAEQNSVQRLLSARTS
jgi:hypothetical protein